MLVFLVLHLRFLRSLKTFHQVHKILLQLVHGRWRQLCVACVLERRDLIICVLERRDLVFYVLQWRDLLCIPMGPDARHLRHARRLDPLRTLRTS